MQVITEKIVSTVRSNEAIQESKLKLIVNEKTEISKSYDYIGWMLLSLIVVITLFGSPSEWHIDHVTLHHVWYYGWITAVSTGLGALPFAFCDEISKKWMGYSNGIAAGMMLAASYSLAYEGMTFTIQGSSTCFIRHTVAGIICGVIFITATKALLDQFGDVSLDHLSKSSPNKMILIVFVMTLHSMTEGIGIGVSFGGKMGSQMGQYISMSLAVHNVPEGLAVALVSSQQKVSTVRSILWAILTSIPQPLMAVPAFLFVERFVPFLPAGLGFASGAMAYVAIFELLLEAVEDSSVASTAMMSSISFVIMMLIQDGVKLSL